MTDREFDIVLFGATGFTGRLVADYLARRASAAGDIAQSRVPLRWAIVGRKRAKLEALDLGVPIIVADACDPSAMTKVAGRARVVCTTVGPYTRYGTALVAACAESGTHYCDLTAEVPWMRRMIDAHDARARETGARIVHACGFDSIPSDLGVFLAQAEMTRRFGHPAARVTAFYDEPHGGISGGTIGSAIELAEASRDPEIARLMANPYALDPDPTAARPPAPDPKGIGWNRELRRFTAPFLMAFANTRIVRRAHALAGFPWGSDFVYREVMTTHATPRGLVTAAGISIALAGVQPLLRDARMRALLLRRLPRPGEGPTPEARASGHWRVRFVAEGHASERIAYVVADRAEPGYDSTAKMLGESALSLAFDPPSTGGGFLTPSVAMGHRLADRLRLAGLTLAPDA